MMRLFDAGIRENNWVILDGKPSYIHSRSVNSNHFVVQTDKEEIKFISPYLLMNSIPIYNPHNIDIFGQKPLQLRYSLRYPTSGKKLLCLCDNGDFVIDSLSYADCCRACKGITYEIESFSSNEDGGDFVEISGEWHHASFFWSAE